MFPKLMTTRRFAPLFWCQFFSAFNDNFLKNALVFLILFKIGGSDAEVLVTLAGAVYLALISILPQFLTSGFKVAPIPFVGEWLDANVPRFFTEGLGVTFYFGGTSTAPSRIQAHIREPASVPGHDDATGTGVGGSSAPLFGSLESGSA